MQKNAIHQNGVLIESTLQKKVLCAIYWYMYIIKSIDNIKPRLF